MTTLYLQNGSTFQIDQVVLGGSTSIGYDPIQYYCGACNTVVYTPTVGTLKHTNSNNGCDLSNADIPLGLKRAYVMNAITSVITKGTQPITVTTSSTPITLAAGDYEISSATTGVVPKYGAQHMKIYHKSLPNQTYNIYLPLVAEWSATDLKDPSGLRFIVEDAYAEILAHGSSFALVDV